MRFGRTPEQRDFAAAVDRLLSAAAVPQIAREWADGRPERGLKLWSALADLGVAGLAVPEQHGGLGASAVDLTVAFERLGYHAVPGPWAETAALAPVVLGAIGDPTGLLPGIADGTVCVTLAVPPSAPYAVDAFLATHLFLVADGQVSTARIATSVASVDPTRRPARVTADAPVGHLTPAAQAVALDHAALAVAAQLVGAGERMLHDAVAYVTARTQFGRAIGEYQAVKHLLADARVALDFAAPLVHGAALALDGNPDTAARDVSAAKVAASDAAYLTARTALQVHGAIGYTMEYDLSLWFTRTRALIGAWGTPSWHRARVLASLVGGAACASD
jgi:alkylation response protein AidB-like acyl-CoA dehydrogenase